LATLKETDKLFNVKVDNYYNVYMKDLLVCFMRRKNFEVQEIIDVFLIALKLGELEYFLIYYRQFKKSFADKKNTESYENLNWVFFTLVDSEMSLRAGCSNEFLNGVLEVLKAYHGLMRFSTIKLFVQRAIAVIVAADNSKGDKPH
jgi:hypothetical protein